jgi:LuxR family transcriptional regulator, quorum-sensing system regulator ExpR
MSDLKFTKIFSLSKRYNIVNGLTFVLHDHLNNLALLSVVIGSQRTRGAGKTYSHPIVGAMQMLLIDINEQMYRLAGSAIPRHAAISIRQTRRSPFSPHGKRRCCIGRVWVKPTGRLLPLRGISVSTVKFHMGNTVVKLGVSNARQAIRRGVELELITPAATAGR